jgi:hypothetical protein
MRITNLVSALGLTLAVGCVHSHRTAHYAATPAVVTPTSTRPPVRVYQEPTRSVITTSPEVVTAPVITGPPVVRTPAVVTTPSVVTRAPVVTTPSVTTIPSVTVPSVIVETPPDAPTSAQSENLALAENIRRALAADTLLNSAARDVRMSVYNGRVTMTGRTVSEAERQRLHSAISGLPGVYRLDDRIQVDLR